MDAVSSEFTISRESALLRLELADGRTVESVIRDGAAFVDGRRIGDAPRGEALDRSWRELLNDAMDAASADVPALLAGWSAPGSVGSAMATALQSALQVPAGASGGGINIVTVPPGSTSDSVDAADHRINELERAAQQARGAPSVRRSARQSHARPAASDRSTTSARALPASSRCWSPTLCSLRLRSSPSCSAAAASLRVSATPRVMRRGAACWWAWLPGSW
jgi:hypothetical protein